MRLRGETQGRRPALPSPWSWPSPLTGSSPLCPTLGALWVISLHCLRPAQGAGPPGPPGCGETRAPPVFGVCVGPALLGSRTPFSSSPAPSSRPGSSSLAASRSAASRDQDGCVSFVAYGLCYDFYFVVSRSSGSALTLRPRDDLPLTGQNPNTGGGRPPHTPRRGNAVLIRAGRFLPRRQGARVSAGSRVIRNGLSKALCFLKASSIHFGAVVSFTFSREMGRIAGLAPRSEPGWRSAPRRISQSSVSGTALQVRGGCHGSKDGYVRWTLRPHDVTAGSA